LKNVVLGTACPITKSWKGNEAGMKKKLDKIFLCDMKIFYAFPGFHYEEISASFPFSNLMML
jgi:hypothetical protein